MQVVLQDCSIKKIAENKCLLNYDENIKFKKMTQLKHTVQFYGYIM